MSVGCEAISVMCDILNMSPPCQQSSWNERLQALYQAYKETAEGKLTKAREHVHKLHQKQNPEITKDDVTERAVSFDGTWLKHKFTANFIVGFIISVDTKQVLDFGFASKICIQRL